MHQLLAVLRRDALGAFQKRSPLLVQLVLVLVLPTLLALQVHAWQPVWGDMDPLGALMLGLVVADTLWTATIQWSRVMHRAQVRGELEALLATGARLGNLLLLTPGFQALVSLVRCVLYIVIMVGVYGASLETGQFHSALLFLLLMGFGFGSVGVMSMCMTLAMRSREPFGPLFWLTSLLICGTLSPIHALPPRLGWLGQHLPPGALLEGLRMTLLRNTPLEALQRPLISLGLSTCVLILMAWFVARRTRRLLLREGIHGDT